MRDRRLWRLGLGSALLVTAQSGILAFAVVYLHEERGLSVVAAAATLARMQLAGALTRVAAGRWSDQRDARVDPMRRLGLAAAAIALILTAVLGGHRAELCGRSRVLALAGALAMSWNGLSFTAAAEMSGRARAGTAIGIQNTMLSVAGVVAPVTVGATVTLLSWPAAYAMLAVPRWPAGSSSVPGRGGGRPPRAPPRMAAATRQTSHRAHAGAPIL